MAKKKTNKSKQHKIGNTDNKLKDEIKRPRKKKNIFAVLIIILSVALLSFGAVKIILGIKPLKSDVGELDEEWVTPQYIKGKTMNILICGIDSDEKLEGDETRVDHMTDVIIMLNLNIENLTATLLQIPRDMYVGQELVYYGKINGLYNWGYKDNSEEKGDPKNAPSGVNNIRPLAETINKQLALPIDNYVMITMEGFREVVDMLGGIEITVDKFIEFGDHFELHPGKTYVLNGETAEVFVRYRGYSQADIERMNVQRYFMSALMKKFLDTSTPDLMRIVNNVFPYLETDFSIGEIIDLAFKMKKMSTDSINVIRVPGEPVSGYGLYGQDVFSVHKKELAELLNKYMRPFSEPVIESELGAIEIQNTIGDYLGTAEGKLDEYEDKSEEGG